MNYNLMGNLRLINEILAAPIIQEELGYNSNFINFFVSCPNFFQSFTPYW